MKKKFLNTIVFLLFFGVIVNPLSFADVIWSPNASPSLSIAASVEMILSYEYVLSKKNTGLFWLGGGFIKVLRTDQSFLFGLEIALDFRHYFKPDKYEKFFIGIYGGGCIMYIIHRHSSDNFDYPGREVTVGVKLGYKKVLNKLAANKRLVIEPYTSLSTPLTKHVEARYYPLVTVGLRLVYEWIPKKNKVPATNDLK
jgi:hypothetical protein